MAPDPNIVLLTSPVDETKGVQGMPQFNALENYALDNHLGQVISQSWGATENALFTPAGEQVFKQFGQLLKDLAFLAQGNPSEQTILSRANSLGS